MTASVYIDPEIVREGLRRLVNTKFSRKQRTLLMGYLAIKKKAGGAKSVRVEGLGTESVADELSYLFGIAPATRHPLINPFGVKEERLEYLRPEYSRSGVFTHLYPGRALSEILEVTTEGNARVVTIPEDAAKRIAETKIPLEPALAFLLRNEEFPASATVNDVITRAKDVLGLSGAEINDLFVHVPDFEIKFGQIQFQNSLAEIPIELQPAVPASAHAATANISNTAVAIASRSSVQITIDSTVQRRLTGAFRSSKAIALVGPPGTAKSWMMEDILEQSQTNPALLGLSTAPEYDRHTAEVDWSARTLIGGYYPQADGRLLWQEGHLLRAIRDNRSLWIDEMNRADLDRVLGPILTFLAGQRVDLGPTHLADGQTAEQSKAMTLVWADRPDSGVNEDEEQRTYFVGTDWRLLGTYNNVDLGRVFPMGAALTRRWAIIPVQPLSSESLLEVLKQVPNLPSDAANVIASIYEIHLQVVPIGPAPFIDMAKYVAENCASTSSESHPPGTHIHDAYVLYLAQQLRRLDPDQYKSFIDGLAAILGQGLKSELAGL